jgi:hypothetical protein
MKNIKRTPEQIVRKLACVLMACSVLVVGLVETSCSSLVRTPTILVADVSSLSPPDQITFTALEGIVNRARPQVYLEGLKNGQDFENDTAAPLWLRDAVPMVPRRTTPDALLRQFHSAVKGLVIWNPAMAVDTQNVATTLAGIDDLLPVSPNQAATLTRAPYGFKVVEDLRREHFTSRIQAYSWVLDRNKSTHFAFPAWLGGPRNGRSTQPGLRDWIVAKRGFAFEANPMTEPDVVHLVLSAFPPMTPVFGYPFFDDALYQRTGIALGEPIGVGEISRAGDFLIPTADATNLSALNHFSAPRPHPKWNDATRAPNPNKTYVCFLLSDGDNVGTDETVLRTLHWNESARGSIAVGTSMSPWLRVLEPTVYAYYVKTMTPADSFVASPSGGGYAYPSQMPDLAQYLNSAATMMNAAGLHAVWILDNGYVSSPNTATIDQYVKVLHPSIIFTDYTVLPSSNPTEPPPLYFVGGTPVIHAIWSVDVQSTVSVIKATAGTPGRPSFVFIGLSAWSMSYAKAAAIMRQLGPSFQAVTPDTFAGLLRGSQGTTP